MLDIRHLRKTYGDLVAVDDVSFTLKPGELVGLLGPNGAGKTTTVSIISGFVAQDRGDVLIDGEPMRGDTDAKKRRIGLVPQDLALYDELSAAANLRFFGALYGMAGKPLDEAIDRTLTLVGLADRAKHSVKSFSGGMKRRLNLAAGLLHDPQILLLDEPTVGVDPQSRNAIFDNLEQLKAAGKALLYTTHYMEEAERLADRLVIIDHGRVVAADSVAGMRARVPGANGQQLSLEAVFLALTGKEPARLMLLTPLFAMVRKDLLLFLTDRRAVIMSFVAPIAIASFFGSIFSGDQSDRARIAVALVDQDRSAISRGIVAAVNADATFQTTVPTADEARASVREGDIIVGVLIPAGFGEKSGRAFFGGAEKPELTMWYDPSHAMELALVRGVMTQHVMEVVSQEVFSGSGGTQVIDDTLKNLESNGLPADQQALLRQLLTSARAFYQAQPATDAAGTPAAGRGIAMPYTVEQEALTSGANVAYNGYAHSFAGMGIQFLLFSSIDLGIGILLERQRGLWKRLRSAPLSRFMLLGGKALSGALIALMTLLVSFGFAMLIFKVRIAGSLAGFGMVAAACAVMASTFGILIASLGRTPGGSRGMASLSVLLMVMLGGAWVPTFIFPHWLQRITFVVPARWAVDGLDAMTWRGLGIGSAVVPTLALLGFAAVFSTIALARFRWEET